MDWRTLLHNRWVWVGAAGAAGLGLVTFLRNRSKAGGGANVEGDTAGYQTGGVGYFDSTAADIAQQLGQTSAQWDAQFREFTGDVNDRIAALQSEVSTPSSPPPAFPGDPYGRNHDVQPGDNIVMPPLLGSPGTRTG